MSVSKNLFIFGGAAVALIAFVVLNPKPKDEPTKAGIQLVRVAYMPNLTHAPAVYGFEKGSFKADMPEADLKAVTFNAGPEEMEAIRAGAIDIAFAGPGPIIQNLAKGDESAIVLLDGSCSGGASLVCRANLEIKNIADLAKHSVAVPQLGGTQDISLRHFLEVNKLAPIEKGGTVTINPVKNADLPLLFSRGGVDSAWVPEPWASILRVQYGAKLVVDERDLWPGGKFPTTLLVARKQFALEHPEIVKKFQEAHKKAVDELNANLDLGLVTVGNGLNKLTGKKLPKEALESAWKSLAFSTEVLKESMLVTAKTQVDNGYLKKIPDGSDWLAASVVGGNGR